MAHEVIRDIAPSGGDCTLYYIAANSDPGDDRTIDKFVSNIFLF